ncbi:MAG TPA: GatB/YqeY domain-containing protein [Acidimicrobiia bacterium]|nr:GatB/YqeY domain-containing protein [Acidimicrobiia bacterium]
MSIREELADELRDAMKAKDARRRDVIRQVETEVAIARSRPGFEGELDDELYRQVIGTYVKKMEKSRQEYLDIGDRGAAMADKLGYEVEYLSRWLPQKLDEEATRALIREAIAELGVAGEEKAAGRVVGHLMKSRGEDLDGGLVNRLAREELTAG